MTDELNPLSEEQRWLDKLVDGELDDAQRRRLLAELEREPEGWRRCALAFLEAQAWRHSLGELVSSAPKDGLPRPVPADSRRWSSWGTVLAAAASFLVAFALGLAWRGHAQPDAPAVAHSQPAPAAEPARPSAPESALASDKQQWGTMTVLVDRTGDGVPESVELPVVRGPGIDEQWVRNQPSGIPPSLLRALQRMGHEVEHQRQYYPFELGDGGRVIVPVDEVNVHYVGERRFQ